MNNNFKSLTHSKRLMDDSKTLMAFHDRFEEATKTGNNGRIDKFRKGFNVDDRFQDIKASVYFTAYTGAYGSSSVGSFLRLNSGKDIGLALIKYLNDNEEAVLKGMAAILDGKAKDLISAARSELETASALINDIEAYESEA